MNKTLELCCELMRRRSVTPTDAGCQQVMAERLRQAGFTVTALPRGEVTNFWAQHGSQGPLLAFAGHTDVVPTGPEADWLSPPFEPTLTEDGWLRGRGAADMKASLAAMVVACEEFVEAHPDHPGRIGLLITSDEEGPAIDGTVRVVEYLQNKGMELTWCLVGEPSSSNVLGDTVKNGRRGSLGAVLTIRGLQGHIAYPHLADNPIHRALPALTELTSQHWDSGNAYFPATSLQISNINGGTGATNVIPGLLSLQFNFRFSTEVTPEQLQQRCEAILDRHGLDYAIEWDLSGKPFLTPPGDLVDAALESIRDITGVEGQLSTTGGTSDGRFIAPMGCQVVELGPVNASIHQVNERVLASDLPRLTAIYKGILSRLLLSPAFV